MYEFAVLLFEQIYMDFYFISHYSVSIADTGNISTIVESLIEHSDWFFPEGNQFLFVYTNFIIFS